MAVVPVTTSPPQQLMGWAGLPESQLWFIVLFRLVKAMLSSVNSSINPRGKELMFPKFIHHLLSHRAFLWEVGSPWGWMPASPSFIFYYCLLGVLSNLCCWANFYDWCGILQKLLSAKLLNVIPQNFSWWQIPRDWTLLSKGPGGAGGMSEAESCTQLCRDR